MKSRLFHRAITAALVSGVTALAIAATATAQQSASPKAAQVKPVASESLPNSPGNRLTAVEVSWAPGAESTPHHHAGYVFVYVLEGSVRSAVDGGEPKIYAVGDHFVEPPGSHHTISGNASSTAPAKILAIFVAPEGAELTSMDK